MEYHYDGTTESITEGRGSCRRRLSSISQPALTRLWHENLDRGGQTKERKRGGRGDSYFATVLFVTIRSSVFMQLIRDFTFSEEYWHVCTFFKFEDTFEICKNVICVIVCLFIIFYRNYVSYLSYLLYLSGISKRFFDVLKKYTTVKDKNFLARLNQFAKFCKFNINKYLWVILTSLIIKQMTV